MAATAERWPYSFYARWMSYVNRNQRGPAVKPNRKRPPRLPLRESPLGSCHRDGTFESRAGDIGVPDRSPALTRHDAEFHLWPVQDSEHWSGCPEMKRPLSGFVSRQPLRAVHLRTSALAYCTSRPAVVKLNSDSPKTQPPPLRAAGDLFPHMADESETNVVAGRNLSSSGIHPGSEIDGHEVTKTE